MKNTIGFIGFQVLRLGRNQGEHDSVVNLVGSRIVASDAGLNSDGIRANGDRRKIWDAIIIAID